MNVSEFIQSCMRFIYCVLLIGAVLTGFTFIGAVEVTAKHIFFLLAVALVTMIGNRIFVNDRRYMTLWSWLMMTGCSLFIVTWLTGIKLEYWQINTFIGFWCSVTNFMIFVVAMVPNGQIGRFVKCVMFMVMLVPVLMLWTHFVATGQWIEDTVLLAKVLQMDVVSAMAYTFQGTGFFPGALLLVAWGGLSYIFSGGGRLIFERLTASTIIGCLLFLLLNGALMYRTQENMVMTHVYQAYDVLNQKMNNNKIEY